MDIRASCCDPWLMFEEHGYSLFFFFLLTLDRHAWFRCMLACLLWIMNVIVLIVLLFKSISLAISLDHWFVSSLLYGRWPAFSALYGVTKTPNLLPPNIDPTNSSWRCHFVTKSYTTLFTLPCQIVQIFGNGSYIWLVCFAHLICPLLATLP